MYWKCNRAALDADPSYVELNADLNDVHPTEFFELPKKLSKRPNIRLARKATHLAGLYTIGATGPTLADLAGPSAIRCGDLEGAVQAALPRMGADDILLLSPGCASWDQFPNYEARGEAFLALIRPLLQRGSSETS